MSSANRRQVLARGGSRTTCRGQRARSTIARLRVYLGATCCFPIRRPSRWPPPHEGAHERFSTKARSLKVVAKAQFISLECPPPVRGRPAGDWAAGHAER